jgi:hypothetical protein
MMTTKPKTRKALAAGDYINPVLIARAVKLADAWKHYRKLHSLVGADDEAEADNAASDAIVEVCEHERRLSRIPATNLAELRIKAKYACPDFVDDPLANSIISDLCRLNRKREAS